MLWVTITMVSFCFNSKIRSSIFAVEIGSSAEAGSSISITSGLTARARASSVDRPAGRLGCSADGTAATEPDAIPLIWVVEPVGRTRVGRARVIPPPVTISGDVHAGPLEHRGHRDRLPADNRLEAVQGAALRVKLKRLKKTKTTTLDGTAVELHANIELPDDVMDVMLTLWTNTALGDGVRPERTRYRDMFPYFVPVDTDS